MRSRRLIRTLAVCGTAAHCSFALGQGPVIGFGDNTYGQLNIPPGLYLAVACAEASATAIRADHTLAGWGWDSLGQANVPSGTFTSVVGGWNHFLAIRTDGTVAGWGYNGNGQATPPPGQFTQVAAGKEVSYGLRADGTIAYWGSPGSGTLGIPPAQRIAASYDWDGWAAAVLTDGTLRPWGNAIHGLVNVPPGTFVDVACASFGAALRADGEVVFWGDYAPAPGIVGGNIVRIAAHGGLVLGLRSDGTLTSNGGTLPPGTYTGFGIGGTFWLAIAATCYANCDNSTFPPRLNANDFQCFLNKFAAGDSFSNCDGSTTLPILNANDFQCLLNTFAAGCS